MEGILKKIIHADIIYGFNAGKTLLCWEKIFFKHLLNQKMYQQLSNTV